MKFTLSLWTVVTQTLLMWVITPLAWSQIVPDDTLSTQVEQIGNKYTVTGGGTAGNNLFHSFREFSIPPGMIAVFDQAGNIQNIFSRVTGNSISNIEGTLKASGVANFFLINPNGIIFSSDASLDIAGSFIASTASSIRFADGFEFSAKSPSSTPVLTVSVPIGLQFGNNAGSIINRSVNLLENTDPSSLQFDDSSDSTVDSSISPFAEPTRETVFNRLEVNSGKTLALVGGAIKLEQVNLRAIRGRIELGSVADNSFVHLIPIDQGWQLSYEGVNSFSDIDLSSESIVDVSGAQGTVQLTARNITLSEGTQIILDALGTESSGDLIVNASESLLLAGSTPTQTTGFGAYVGIDTSGDSGNITINTIRLEIRDGAAIGIATDGQGQGGELTINAKVVEIVGVDASRPSLLTTSTGGKANAGPIIINTERLAVLNGGAILAVTVGDGDGGIITINASQSVEVSGQATLQSAEVSEQETLSLREIQVPSLISTSSGFEDLNDPGTGAGGNLNINTGQLIISHGGQIDVGSFQGGEAGNLNVNARSILLNQGSILAQSTSGAGGNLFINASDLLVLRNNSLISATAGTQQAGGDGGNINITVPFIFAVPKENSDISADAFRGTGGNVSITETGLFGLEFRNRPTPLSDITASSQFGQSGSVTLNRPEVDPQTGLVTLPSEIVNAENLVVESCETGGALARGRFVITGRGGIPTDPYEIPELNRELVDLGGSQVPFSPPVLEEPLSNSISTPNSTESIVEAQGWMTDTQGKVILTAQASEVTPNSSGFSSTQCKNRK